MKEIKSWLLLVVGSALLLATSLIFTSCTTSAAKGVAAKDKGSAAALGAAQLWSQNCGHCHNIRSPDSYSDAQWEVVMLHMRVRANLTADEEKKILAFMKSAH